MAAKQLTLLPWGHLVGLLEHVALHALPADALWPQQLLSIQSTHTCGIAQDALPQCVALHASGAADVGIGVVKDIPSLIRNIISVAIRILVSVRSILVPESFSLPFLMKSSILSILCLLCLTLPKAMLVAAAGRAAGEQPAELQEG